MITLLLIILFSIILYFKSSFIKKNNLKFYLGSTLLALASFFIKDFFVFVPFSKGFLGLGLFYLVMIAGALPNWTFKKKLFTLRTELSIIGFIAITPHALLNLIKIFQGSIEPTFFGIIAYAIMIPLFITSFISVRKRMKAPHWKNLQRLAYIVYLLLFIHLIINYSLPINRILYIVLLLTYLIFKTTKIIQLKFFK